MSTPALELREVTKTYGHDSAKVQALKPTDFQAWPGQFVVLLGPSGSGKSTMLNLAGCLISPTSGEIFIQGHPVTALSAKELDTIRLKKLGFVLQSHNLVPFLKVKEQFTLVDKTGPTQTLTAEELTSLLTTLGVDALVDKFPQELSGGQNQRVALARALYTKPALLLADEPTAALDSHSVTIVAELLRRLAHSQNTCIIVVTHDERLVEYADVVARMEDGRLSVDS